VQVKDSDTCKKTEHMKSGLVEPNGPDPFPNSCGKPPHQGDASLISGYLGTSPRSDDAMGEFAVAYADQVERDHAPLKAAVRRGKIEVYRE